MSIDTYKYMYTHRYTTKHMPNQANLQIYIGSNCETSKKNAENTPTHTYTHMKTSNKQTKKTNKTKHNNRT